jgi:hypothetical protein
MIDGGCYDVVRMMIEPDADAKNELFGDFCLV